MYVRVCVFVSVVGWSRWVEGFEIGTCPHVSPFFSILLGRNILNACDLVIITVNVRYFGPWNFFRSLLLPVAPNENHCAEDILTYFYCAGWIWTSH